MFVTYSYEIIGIFLFAVALLIQFYKCFNGSRYINSMAFYVFGFGYAILTYGHLYDVNFKLDAVTLISILNTILLFAIAYTCSK
jgi:hypothetical protein